MRSRCAGGRLFRTSDLMAGGNFLNAAQKATNKLVVIGGASIIVFLAACIAGVEALHLLQRARQTREHARAALDLSGAFIVKPVAGDGLLDGGKFALDQALDARRDRGSLGGRLARRGGRNWCGVFHGLALRVGKRDAARAAAPAPLAQAREEGALGDAHHGGDVGNRPAGLLVEAAAVGELLRRDRTRRNWHGCSLAARRR